MNDLEPLYTNQKSFYNKAHVEVTPCLDGTKHTLLSYGTKIIELFIPTNSWFSTQIIFLTPRKYDFTKTTLIHLNEFIQQHGGHPLKKAQWLALLEEYKLPNPIESIQFI